MSSRPRPYSHGNAGNESASQLAVRADLARTRAQRRGDTGPSELAECAPFRRLRCFAARRSARLAAASRSPRAPEHLGSDRDVEEGCAEAESLEMFDAEARRADCGVSTAGSATAAHRAPPEAGGVERSLRSRGARARRADVLVEPQLAAGPDHAREFGEGGRGIVDAAEHAGAHSRVN